MNKVSQFPVIHVNMLGDFSITIEDKHIKDTNNQSKKPWSLLEYLIAFHTKEISTNELIELIWSDEESNNPGGALKTLLFRSRKLLEPLGFPPQQLIVRKRGAYCWTNEFTTILDTDLFDQLCKQILDSTAEAEECLELCFRALKLYKGDFLPNSEWENWVIPISTYYHNLYQKLVHKTIELLRICGDHQKIIEICQKAVNIEQYDESIHYALILSLYRSGSQQLALEHYRHTVDMFYKQFAITPSQQFQDLYKMIRDTEHGINIDLSSIQTQLQEETCKNGAFYCEYSVFKDVYQLECRSIERTGDSIYLCLLTITDSKGMLLKTSVLNRAMSELKQTICHSLRRGDLYTRFSISQYMILLPTATFENGEQILRRIFQNYRKNYPRRDIEVSYSLQNVIEHG